MFLHEGSSISREFTNLYGWWASILIIELMSFVWQTGQIRVRHEIIHSNEDRMWLKNRDVILHPSGGGHPQVDHIRSGHFRDLGAIISYLLIAPIWLNTNPPSFLVKTLLRLFPVCKILDTLLYMEIIVAPQFCRYLTLALSYFVTVYMSISILL